MKGAEASGCALEHKEEKLGIVEKCVALSRC